MYLLRRYTALSTDDGLTNISNVPEGRKRKSGEMERKSEQRREREKVPSKSLTCWMDEDLNRMFWKDASRGKNYMYSVKVNVYVYMFMCILTSYLYMYVYVYI